MPLDDMVIDKPLFEHRVNLAELNERGVQWTKLNSEIADSLLALVREQNFATKVDYDTGPNSKKYKNRFEVDWQGSMPPSSFRPLNDAIIDQILPPIVNLYGPTKTGEFSLFKCTKGYEMELHDHLAQRTIFDILIYLGDEITEEDGGCFNLAKVHRGEQGEVLHSRIISKHVPSHGDVAFIDGLSIRFQHGVEELLSDKDRFFLAKPIGSEEF